MGRDYRARHHKYIAVEDDRDRAARQLRQTQSQVPTVAQVMALAKEVARPEFEAAVIADDRGEGGWTGARVVDAPLTRAEQPYVPVVQPNRRVRTLPSATIGNTTFTQVGEHTVASQLASFVTPSPAHQWVADAHANDQQIADEIDQMIGVLPVVEVPPQAAPLADATLDSLPIGHFAHEYLSGTAGTGKTTLAKKLDELSPIGTLEIAATTGIAAVNLGEGTTINALLGYFDAQDLQEKYVTGRLHAMIRRHKKAGLRRIVLDEVSMMDGRVLTMITRALDEVNQGGDLEKFGDNYDEFEGGEDANTDDLAITLVGDFAQLSPVPDEDPTTGRKIPMTYAFESAEWKQYAPHVTKLTTIHRQTDRDFIEALHAVRRGDPRSALTFFTAQRFSETTDERFDGATVLAKNAEVDRYNQLRLDAIAGSWMTAQALRWGKQRGDWKQVPDQLRLKETSLVMILANERAMDTKQMVYANGDLGELVGQDTEGEAWLVRLKRTGGVVKVRRIGRENTIPLQPGRRKELVAQGLSHLITKDKKREVVGTIQYMPLRCAFGCTVHKTQGLTLDRVQVNLKDPFFKHPGMLFVALSRCRTAEGLRIVGNQVAFFERCKVDPRVLPWL